MKFNIESETQPKSIPPPTDKISRDLPILFPYPRIYPGQGFKVSSSVIKSLTNSRAICVCGSKRISQFKQMTNDMSDIRYMCDLKRTMLFSLYKSGYC